MKDAVRSADAAVARPAWEAVAAGAPAVDAGEIAAYGAVAGHETGNATRARVTYGASGNRRRITLS